MINISGWHKRYECNSRGQEAKEGDELRVGPLKYIKLKAHGRRQGTGYRRMKALAGKDTMQVFGIFCKFLEIAGDQPKELRGKLLNEHDEAATPDDLAFILDVPVQQIKAAITVLCDKSVGWLIQENIIQYNTIQGPRNPLESPGKTGKFKKPTPGEVTSYAKSKGYNLDGQRFCDHYESNGWKVGRNAMKSWKAAVRTWKANGYDNGNQQNAASTAQAIADRDLRETQEIIRRQTGRPPQTQEQKQ